METIIKIRLTTYKSFRHYGGREITPTYHICNAKLIAEQRDHTFYVELLEDCAIWKAGYKIAVLPINYNVM
jgi:hypothetical protein